MPERFQARDATGPNWDWLPDWVVVDTERQVRVAAYNDRAAAAADCNERNREREHVGEQLPKVPSNCPGCDDPDCDGDDR
jgi:hypothetical protein